MWLSIRLQGSPASAKAFSASALVREAQKSTIAFSSTSPAGVPSFTLFMQPAKMPSLYGRSSSAISLLSSAGPMMTM